MSRTNQNKGGARKRPSPSPPKTLQELLDACSTLISELFAVTPADEMGDGAKVRQSDVRRAIALHFRNWSREDRAALLQLASYLALAVSWFAFDRLQPLVWQSREAGCALARYAETMTPRKRPCPALINRP